jgi:hypothetical protein
MSDQSDPNSVNDSQSPQADAGFGAGMSGKLTRLRTEQESLTQEWNKLQEKVKRLSQDLAIESGAARKFQLEQELAEAKAQKASVERELEAVEDAIVRETNLRPFDSNPSMRTAAAVSSEPPIVQSPRQTTVSAQFVQLSVELLQEFDELQRDLHGHVRGYIRFLEIVDRCDDIRELPDATPWKRIYEEKLLKFPSLDHLDACMYRDFAEPIENAKAALEAAKKRARARARKNTSGSDQAFNDQIDSLRENAVSIANGCRERATQELSQVEGVFRSILQIRTQPAIPRSEQSVRRPESVARLPLAVSMNTRR